MADTKERILQTALRLFAADGYEAVSVSTIAGELGMTKGALYKHYKNKQDIFDSIVARMEQQDAEQAGNYEVPEGTVQEMETAYQSTSLEQLLEYSKAQFRYWTEDSFAALFRKMLTLEQFRSEKMGQLYQQYLAAGPMGYVADLFAGMGFADPQKKAASFYAPMFLLYTVYDGAKESEKASVTALADACLEQCYQRLKKEKKMTESIKIRLEKPEEHREVENLVRESFWNVYRPGCLEHYVLNQLRKDPAFVPELDLVMELDGKIIGQNMFMNAEIAADDGRSIPIMTMGPICITPELKRKGYGKILLDTSLEKAAELGYGAICIEGNIDFYGKSGFRLAREFGIRYHDMPEGEEPPFFLCKELIPGYLNGITGEYAPPAGYFVDEQEAEKFDQEFPVKEKKVLPGQLF